jgi:hypothetical protein
MNLVHRSSRALLGVAAFAAFAGAFVMTPLVVNGESGVAAIRVPSAAPSPAAALVARTMPRRNPFAGGHATSIAATAPSPQPTRGVPPATGIPALLQPLPPNAGAPNAPFPFATPVAPDAAPVSARIAAPVSARVTAIVTGPRPYALIEEGGAVRLVTAGDRIGADTIAAITAESIRLAGGTLLHLTPAGRPSR